MHYANVSHGGSVGESSVGVLERALSLSWRDFCRFPGESSVCVVQCCTFVFMPGLRPDRGCVKDSGWQRLPGWLPHCPGLCGWRGW